MKPSVKWLRAQASEATVEAPLGWGKNLFTRRTHVRKSFWNSKNFNKRQFPFGEAVKGVLISA